MTIHPWLLNLLVLLLAAVPLPGVVFAQSSDGAVLSLSEAVSLPAAMDEAKQQAVMQELHAWWLPEMARPLRPEATVLPMSLESLLVRTVSHSSQIRVFSELPLIRRTAITEASAAFDWAAFLDSQWNDTNDPVGSLLVGASRRYRNNQLTTTGGVRRRNSVGGLVEASQQFGVQDTNSVNFIPNPQGTSRIRLSYTHPVLRGNGEIYNRSLICLATIDTQVAELEFSRELQTQLTEVARAYWSLHIARASVVIRHRSLQRAQQVRNLLQERQELDAVRPQILRAEAEVAARESAVIRALMTVRSSEARIRSLVNDPELGTWATTEFLTLDVPVTTAPPISLQQARESALAHRPEIQQALQQIRAASVRLQMSRQEMLPLLNLVTETYVAGLQNDASVGDAWLDQFHEGGPSLGVGAEFEVPLGRRAALSQRHRRQLEARQLQHQYETTLHSLQLEVGVAVREVQAARAEMDARKAALLAHQNQLLATTERWRLLPGEDGTGSLMLETMLRDQERLATAEVTLLQSWISFNMALFALRKVTGELLDAEQVTWTDYRSECEEITTRIVHKPNLDFYPQPAHAVSSDPVQPASQDP